MASEKPAADIVAEHLARLRSDYLARLPEEFARLETLAAGVATATIDRAGLEELHHRLHKLAGSGGTFGVAALSVHARSLEQRVKAWLADADTLDAPMRSTFVTDIAALPDAARAPAAPVAVVPALGAAGAAETAPRVWLVEDDAALGQTLVRQLDSFNYETRLFPSIDAADSAAQIDHPDMLILDVAFDKQIAAGKAFALPPNLKEVKCPLLFISVLDDFAARMQAAQLGAAGYFVKPLDVPRLINRMVQIFEQHRAPPKRILIVDDDLDLAAHYRLILLGAGIEAEVLHQPEAIIGTIATLRPELVLLDLHMPNYSGPDLAGVIRQHDTWASLPIVYLSAETDLDRQAQALDRGADDFLTKPISDAQLVAAVRVRVERARQLATQITNDSLTGLLKHASIKEATEHEAVRARRSGKPFTVAMLDIDHFKSVNDTYGHAVGDVVISAVAMLLRQRLRQSDIIGRYGGEEFVAVLPECPAENARLVLDDIRRRFSEVRFNHAGKEFNCALSGGLACSAQYPDSNGAALLVAADEALYAAKRGGRNQVRVAPIDTERKAPP